jgi:PPOX class probable F420-dependent enzyme
MFTPESRAFLTAGAHTGKVATVRANGWPHVAPVWYIMDGDTIYFTTWHTTVKAANIRRDGRISICVDDENPPYAFARVDGTAELIDDLDEVRKWATRIAAKYMGEDQAEAYGRRNGVPGEYLVRVTPTKVVFETNIAD